MRGMLERWLSSDGFVLGNDGGVVVEPENSRAVAGFGAGCFWNRRDIPSSSSRSGTTWWPASQTASQTTNKRANESVDQQDKEMTGMQWWSYCDERRFRTHGSISISNANSLSISLWRARYNSLEALYLSIDARITLQGRGGGGRALAPHYSSSPVPTLSRPHSSSIRSRRRST